MPTLIEKLRPTHALAEAMDVAESFCTSEPASARLCDEQGMFSRTFIVTLSDDTEVIVQLKDNELDLTRVALARSLLGDVVPDMHAGKTKRVYFAYIASLIPGTLWDMKKTSLTEDVHIASQVGRLVAACSLGIDSSGIVDHYVHPRLLKILEKEDIPDHAVRSRIEGLLGLTDKLKVLPLALCHIDINMRNIILNDSGEIVGLIDWEQAGLMPLGMNAWCIRYLSVPTTNKIDRVTERTQPMAEAFWKALTVNQPSHIQLALFTAMRIGFVLNVFFEGGAPSPMVMSHFVQRFDWFESSFGSLCSA